MAKWKKVMKKQVLPLIPLRGLTVFPYMILHFDVGREKSIKALEEAMVNNQLIFLVAQKDFGINDPSEKDIYKVGTISRIKQLLKLPGDTVRVLVEGLNRAEISEMIQTEPFFMCEVVEKTFFEPVYEKYEMEALIRKVQSLFEEFFKLSNKISPDIMISIMSIQDPGQLADIIVANAGFKQDDIQTILEEFNPKARLEKLIVILTKEVEILKVEKSINNRVKEQIEKNQKEYYLREKLKAIQKELGEKDGIVAEVEEYQRRIVETDLPEEVEVKALKEAERLLKMGPGSAEGSVIRNYLDWILDLPWNKTTKERFDLKYAEDILEEDHYGLEKVKERILEYLAVRQLCNKISGPILCLVGPPGVGKTSIAKSIAKALNRKYVRMSLGGVKDEADIRGHRKTYVGAMPGRIITALKQAGSKNALILLDEVDKMGNDFRGDPASAMLEVLDSEQNYAFRDHYIEVPFDFSQVMFLTTANNLHTIPAPLLDRMEVIHIPGYTEEEKVKIAEMHLIPKQLKKHGLRKRNIRIDEKTIRDIINYYTREAGVRNLEREIANICRKVAKVIIANKQKSVTISSKNIEKYLGTKKYRYDVINGKDEVGIVTGLAWTPVGGDTLSIEVNVMEGTGKIELTGHLGDIMKESARAAISYIRSRAEELNINKAFYKELDVHIHVPEGAIPKDGPSAGITIATALISALSGVPVKKDVAMTGEITLRGRVLPIGGLKEKALAAYRAGIKTVIIPAENEKDLEEIPENVKSKMKFIPVDNMDAVLNVALNNKSKFICKNNNYKETKEEESNIITNIPEQTKEDLPTIRQ